MGTVSQTGSMTGEPLFASDGYHLTHLSPALEQGVDAGVAVDIDGEARPLPAGTGPDLGADEYDAVQELIFAKIALPPVWEVTGAIPGGSLTQRYLLPFRYGSPDQNAAPLDVTVSDTLPAALSLESQTHWPPMSFSQNGQTLTWQTQAPLTRGQSGMIDITTHYANPQPGQVLTNTASLNTLMAEAVTQVPFYAPILVTPGTGELCPGPIEIRGLAQPGVTVHLFIDGVPLTQVQSNASGQFVAAYTYGGSATETLTAQACLAGGQCSAVSSTRDASTTAELLVSAALLLGRHAHGRPQGRRTPGIQLPQQHGRVLDTELAHSRRLRLLEHDAAPARLQLPAGFRHDGRAQQRLDDRRRRALRPDREPS